MANLLSTSSLHRPTAACRRPELQLIKNSPSSSSLSFPCCSPQPPKSPVEGCKAGFSSATGIAHSHRCTIPQRQHSRDPSSRSRKGIRSSCAVPEAHGSADASDGASEPQGSGSLEGQGGLASNSTGTEEIGKDGVALGRRQAMALAACVPLIAAPSRAGPNLVIPGANSASLQQRDEEKANYAFLENLKSRVSTFTLSNGMKWIVLERHTAPVVACHTFANVGAADEPSGITGIAHLLEHLAFKGTTQVGTRNAAEEALLLDDLDDKFYALRDAKTVGDQARVARISSEFEKAQLRAAELSVPNAYGSLLARQGGVGLNATTSQDSTDYFVSLPANKLELWMALESARFLSPVFRELYSEKEVVKEERRLRVDNAPLGRFTEAFARTAFPSSPYGRPVIGYPEDLEFIGRREVESFFRERYNPFSLTVAIVGDVDPIRVEKLAEKYFGGWQAPSTAVKPISMATWREESDWGEIVQLSAGPREVRLALPTNPFYLEGYLRPRGTSLDTPALSVLSDILSGGRTSRFYKNLVVPGRVLAAQATESFPGDKLPSLFLLSALPYPGRTTDNVARILHLELERLSSTPISEDELAPVKKSARLSFLEVMRSNKGMAQLLSQYEALTGSWENLLAEAPEIDAVCPDDVRKVAGLLFRPSNRVAGHVIAGQPASGAPNMA